MDVLVNTTQQEEASVVSSTAHRKSGSTTAVPQATGKPGHPWSPTSDATVMNVLANTTQQEETSAVSSTQQEHSTYAAKGSKPLKTESSALSMEALPQDSRIGAVMSTPVELELSKPTFEDSEARASASAILAQTEPNDTSSSAEEGRSTLSTGDSAAVTVLSQSLQAAVTLESSEER